MADLACSFTHFVVTSFRVNQPPSGLPLEGLAGTLGFFPPFDMLVDWWKNQQKHTMRVALSPNNEQNLFRWPESCRTVIKAGSAGMLLG